MREIQQEGKAWTPVTSATLSYKTDGKQDHGVEM